VGRADPFVALRSATVVLGGRRLLGPLDLTFDAGAIVGIFGGEGSGKTTLLKLFAGLLTAAEGELWWRDGVPTRGMVFQKDGLLDELTVAENAALPLRRLSAEAREARVAAALAAVGLAADAHKRPRELSGGMKKRAGVARVLAGRAQVKLYDDPAAGLDPVTARAVLQLVAASCDPAGVTLIASADPRGVLPLCHQAFTLEQGALAPFAGEA